jgi:iron(II)-dependent oxidoreductase
MRQAAQTIAETRGRQLSTRSTARELAQRLRAVRGRTLLLASDLSGEQLLGPRLAIVNPPLWEFAHVAWFQEHWCLRYRASAELAPSLIENADPLYNSAIAAHDTRWDLPLVPFAAVQRYLAAVLERVLERLEREPDYPALRYFAELAAAHEEMHCEAFTYTRQTLGYAPPRFAAPAAPAGGAWPGDVQVAGGEFLLGAQAGSGFVFDNEKWAHRVELAPFSLARTAVTNGEFAAFVDDRGYERRELWCNAGWQWRVNAAARAPVYWVRQEGQWMQRVYDRIAPLALHAALIHVNWFEADAWCRWAGRRLPSEAEWEQAAATTPSDPAGTRGKRTYPWGEDAPDAGRANLYSVCSTTSDVAAFAAGDSAWGCRQMLGNAWEWTADWFNPYPGFVRDPYQEYSEPWFGNHKVLRGGCHATSASLLRNTWRNFYTPERRDVFAGFRTCQA